MAQPDIRWVAHVILVSALYPNPNLDQGLTIHKRVCPATSMLIYVISFFFPKKTYLDTIN